jgi:hypothetical protein
MRLAPIALSMLALISVTCSPSPAAISPSAAPPASNASANATIAIAVPVGGEIQPAIGASCGLSNIPPAYYGLLGAGATIKNESGTIVGAATIPKTGTVKSRPNADEFFDKNCLLEAKVPLTGAANFYVVDLGSGFDPKTISRADLEAAGWRFDLSY